MKNIIILSILAFILINKVQALEKNQITITILYDNYLFTEGLKTDWGFSCIVKGTEKTILFDTGTNGDILFYNINKLNVNPKDIELIALSHNHTDHTGGLSSFLGKNNKVSVYIPASFPERFIRKVKETKAEVIPVEKPIEICKDVFLTGEIGTQIIEQSLILNTSKGLIVITGCAHPGIVNIIKRAKEIINKKIYLVFGGFHLGSTSEREVKEIISDFRDLEVINAGPTHCTGDRAIGLFKKAFGENFVQMGVGKVIQISY